MLSEFDLKESVFSAEQAAALAKDARFARVMRNWSVQRLSDRVGEICRVYGVSKEAVAKAVTMQPKFLPLDHKRVLRDITGNYGATREVAAKAVFKFPAFAGYDHQKALENVAKKYATTKERAAHAIIQFPQLVGVDHGRLLQDLGKTYGVPPKIAIKAILNFPALAGYDHKRVIREIIAKYSTTRKIAAHAVITNPRMASYNHERVLNEMAQAYNTNRQTAAQTILAHPKIAGTNHKRVVAQATILGKSTGLTKQDVTRALLENPTLTTYSMQRNVAAIKAIRNAAQRAGVSITPQEGLELYKKIHIQSPFPVTGTKKPEKFYLGKTSQMGLAAQKRIQKRPK